MSIESPITDALNWFTGEHRTWRFPVKQSDGVTPQNTTGWIVHWHLRRARDNPEILITKTALHTDDTNGVLDVVVLAADTQSLTPGRHYWHELLRTDDQFELSFGEAVLKKAVFP